MKYIPVLFSLVVEGLVFFNIPRGNMAMTIANPHPRMNTRKEMGCEEYFMEFLALPEWVGNVHNSCFNGERAIDQAER